MALKEFESLLGDLHFAPPAIGPRGGTRRDSPPSEIRRLHGEPVPLAIPLFAYDMPWHHYDVDFCQTLANDLTSASVMTSLLDLDMEGERPESNVICPYRPERYGLTRRDLANASIVDLRLSNSDGSGSIYTMDRLRRWDHRADTLPDDTLITGASWPADVPEKLMLGRKVDQLRTLAPDAAVFASISPFHFDADLPVLISANVDGIILRFDLDSQAPTAGRVIASLTRACRQHLDAAGQEATSLWTVVPTLSPTDLVKLFALGASAVSIDSLIRTMLAETMESRTPEPSVAEESRGMFSLSGAVTEDPSEPEPEEANSHDLSDSVHEFMNEALAYVHALGVAHYSQLKPHMLACCDRELAAITGAETIADG